MLIGKNIKLSRILINTWQVDIIMIVSCSITYFAREFLITHNLDIPAIIPGVLGTAIAFFIGFNNNQAYDRWWEARKIWGSLVNDSRSWARSLLSYVEENAETKELVRKMICQHIAFLYTLKGALRNYDDKIYTKYLSIQELEEIGKQSNQHNAILNIQSRELQLLSKKGYIDGFRFIQLNQLLVNFTDHMGRSERIKNTVFPTTYSYLTKVFIWLFVVSITLVISPYLEYWSIFIGWLVGFVFVSTQINGMSLINPFENNSAAIPLNQITRTIEINLLEMLGETDIPAPVKPVNEEYVL
ncbi:bestrophin family protein [Pedobacter nutrimenti]|jgi:putative membrane protein|uniref:Putative membrane protein n=1 Tax=Pedobacter nutrimenti TaxID=1241337 RepID=A0A318UH13_9SPHI|nr:bestrophin family ion channel [Pedobacter nutrimenti]PYF75716.1 putative membrane protein [Pedobacter nutrimenti]